MRRRRACLLRCEIDQTLFAGEEGGISEDRPEVVGILVRDAGTRRQFRGCAMLQVGAMRQLGTPLRFRSHGGHGCQRFRAPPGTEAEPRQCSGQCFHDVRLRCISTYCR
jgi:hypothetical protein